MRAALLVLVSLVAAGCLGSPAVDPQADDGAALAPEDILPWLGDGDDHDHHAWQQHDARWNVAPVGHTWLSDDPSSAPANANMVVVHGDLAYVSLYELPGEGNGGLAVVDVSDPTDPQVVGTLVTPHMEPIDVWVTDDGRYALLADHRLKVDGESQPSTPYVGVPVLDKNVGAPYVPAGVTIVDVGDPTEPRQVGHYPLPPSGAHTIKSGVIDGDTYVFTASYGFHRQESALAFVDIARLKVSDEEATLEPVARYHLPERLDRDYEVHDTWFQVHPVTGAPLLYVAAWDAGLHILDLTNPAEPALLAVWDDYDAVRYGNLHSAFPSEVLHHGVHVTPVTGEYPTADHGGMVWFLDTTDPAEPVTLAEFRLPLEPTHSEDFLYSPHNGATRNGVFHHAHNHAGYWAIDFASTPERLVAPKAVGYHFPLPPDATALYEDGAPGTRGALTLWGVGLLDDGTVLASDRWTGLHAFRLVADEPGAPPWAHLT